MRGAAETEVSVRSRQASTEVGGRQCPSRGEVSLSSLTYDINDYVRLCIV